MSEVQIAIIDQEDTQITLAVPGVQGPVGNAIPAGGTTNQVFYKVSGTNYDAGWTFIGNANVDAAAAIAGTKITPDFGAQTIVTTGVVTIGGLNAVSTTKAQNEESQIKLNAAFSVGTAGAIPFGIGPVIPPGMAFAGIGPDSYNPIHLASGSFC